MLLKRITGLDNEQFDELYARVKQILQCRPVKLGGPHEKLCLRSQIQAVLMLLRHNITEVLVGEIFGVEQSTISRIKDRIEPLLDEACAFSELTFQEGTTHRQSLIDGTYVRPSTESKRGR